MYPIGVSHLQYDILAERNKFVVGSRKCIESLFVERAHEEKLGKSLQAQLTIDLALGWVELLQICLNPE